MIWFLGFDIMYFGLVVTRSTRAYLLCSLMLTLIITLLMKTNILSKVKMH